MRRCPYCGNSVTQGVLGFWTCPRCGPNGLFEVERQQAKRECARRLALLNQKPNPPEITVTVSVVFHVDLTETWDDLKNALFQLAPGQTSLPQLLGRVLLHAVSAGICHSAALPDEEKLTELREFLSNTPDLNLGKSTEEILQGALKSVLFRGEAELSPQFCGVFWKKLISARPPEEYYSGIEPDGLDDLLQRLSAAYNYFDEETESEDGNEDEELSSLGTLEQVYNFHLRNAVLLHPDAKRAKQLLSQGKFPEYEDICRELLLTCYPEEVPHQTADDLDDASWECILEDVFVRDVAKGIQMWRFLLDTAGASLKNDPNTAEKLLYDWDWLDDAEPVQALPLLNALAEESFVSQLFESAWIGGLQVDVLTVCHDCGQDELGQRCLAIALKNPHLDSNTEKWIRQVFSYAPARRSTPPKISAARDTKQDDGTVFHYCSVQIQGVHRPYAYLTGGLRLKVGDWVELPFGKDNVLRQGQIKAIMDCTRIAAPWPPEQTKRVLRVTDAPKPTIKIAASEEKPQPQPQPPEKKPELSRKTSPTVRPVVRTVNAVHTSNKSEKTLNVILEKEPHATPEKSFSKRKILLPFFVISAIIGVGIAIYIRQVDTSYNAAMQALEKGEYSSAEEGFADIPYYRDAASLSLYCKYAQLYSDETAEYVGGANELSAIRLQYDTVWQKDIDTLSARVVTFRSQEEAAAAAKYAQSVAMEEARLKSKYSGKLPVKGMPASCLKYTSLGEPDKRVDCLNFQYLKPSHQSYDVYWYDANGKIIAAGTCFRDQGGKNNCTEFVLQSFTQYLPNSNKGGKKLQTFNYGGSTHDFPSIREDYDSPEDYWEENRDWLNDEDEAWDDWYED